MTAERVQRELAEDLRADVVAEICRVQLSRGIGMGHAGREAIADALLAGPLAPLLAAQEAVQRVEAALTRHAVRLGAADVINVLHIRRALDGTT